MKPRTRARALALQALYEIDMSNHPPADVYKTRLEEMTLTDDLAEFSRQIIFGVLPLTNDLTFEEFQRLLAETASGWKRTP